MKKILLALLLLPLLAHADFTGQWSDGGPLKLELFPPGPTKIGVAVLQVNEPGLFIKVIGNWKVITSGKWKGYANINADIAIYERNGKDVTPILTPVEILLGKQGDNLQYIKGSVLRDKTDKYYCPGGENKGPFLFKRTKSAKDMPEFEVPGKHAD